MWEVSIGGEVRGPFQAEVLRRMIARGELSGVSMARPIYNERWAPLKDLGFADPTPRTPAEPALSRLWRWASWARAALILLILAHLAWLFLLSGELKLAREVVELRTALAQTETLRPEQREAAVEQIAAESDRVESSAARLAEIYGLAEIAVRGCFVAAATLFLMWLHQAVRNVREAAPDKATVSPGWAVGWFFAPIACFWMPFMVMRRLWAASARTGSPETAGAEVLFWLWWCCWLAALGVGMAAALGPWLGFWDASPPVGGIEGALALSAGQSVLMILAGLALASLVGRMTTAQLRWRRAPPCQPSRG